MNRTTIQVRPETKRKLDAERRGDERSYDEVINRILSGTLEVEVEFFSVDGDTALNHDILFRIGKAYFMWRKGGFLYPVDERKVKVSV